MPRTALTVITPKGPFPASVAANDLDFVYTASDVANGNFYTPAGRATLVLAQNTDAAPQTLTINTAVDAFNRTNNVTAFSLGIGEFAAFYIGNGLGFIQSDGTVWLNGANANIKWAVIAITS